MSKTALGLRLALETILAFWLIYAVEFRGLDGALAHDGENQSCSPATGSHRDWCGDVNLDLAQGFQCDGIFRHVCSLLRPASVKLSVAGDWSAWTWPVRHTVQ